jgi:hypothetical protein
MRTASAIPNESTATLKNFNQICCLLLTMAGGPTMAPYLLSHGSWMAQFGRY